MAFFLDRGLVVQRVSFLWRAASSGGVRDDTAPGNVASLTFTRKCLLRASDCGCGNGFLFSRRPRPVSQSLQSALTWFQSALAWFRLLRASQMREWLSLTEACLAVASIGPLLVSIGTRLFRLLPASVRRCGNGFLFSQRPRPVSLWNEVSHTLIARRWRCAFFLSDSKGMLDVKDTVLRRELASIALATRKTKNFFRGMLSAFRAGERHRFAS